MASIGKKITAAGTRYYIRLSPGENIERPKIYFGDVSKKDAQAALSHIENLLNSRKAGSVMPTATQDWLKGVPDTLRNRLESLGLVVRQAKSNWTVAAWIADYIAKRPDVKEATRRKWRDVESKLAAFFRTETIEGLTVQTAKNFRTYLQSTVGLSENTLRRHIGIARQFFNAAVDAEIITKNPFRGQSVTVRANESRFFYVSKDTAQKVLGACPDAEWRLIFGLARYGGLRCPSEVLGLKWQDVDREHQRFTVRSSKTEHHANGGIRVVPIFPELEPLFQDAWDAAKEGAVYCIEGYRDTETNLRTQLARWIKRAGLDPWPKLFQNCRSTRETELFKSTGGNIKAVCTWLGNSPAVAMAHYAQVTEADMKEAAKIAILGDADTVLQSGGHPGGQNPAEMPRTESHEQSEEMAVSAENAANYAENKAYENSDHWAKQDSNL